ncbi:HD domain-containing protein [Desulfovibrio sp. OttesenSCG-928-A18]|nr:HD domain-containing protein [Desulfovibrio sp. OttesenSCG-928-A18]
MRIPNASSGLIQALLRTVHFKDAATLAHNVRIGQICSILAKQLAPDIAEYIETAGSLHDIGKIAIPDHILCKYGPLTDDEFRVIKTHSAIGENILERCPIFDNEKANSVARNLVRHHHERWDGTGYPDGKKGEYIPMEARIAAVADAYDAMVSWRIYKRPYTHEHAVDSLQNDSGTHFQDEVVKSFISCKGEVMRVYSDPRVDTSAVCPALDSDGNMPT